MQAGTVKMLKMTLLTETVKVLEMSKVVWSPSKYRAVCLSWFGFPALDLVVVDNFSTPAHNKVIKALSYWPSC